MIFQFFVVWHGKKWKTIFQENDFPPMEENDFHFEKIEN